MSIINKLEKVFTERRRKRAWDLGGVQSSAVIPELIRLMEDRDSGVRRAAVSSLEQYWPTGKSDAITALVKALSDGDVKVRSKAALAVGEFVPQSANREVCRLAKEALIGLLENEGEEEVIENAVIALANIQDAATVEPMINALGAKGERTVDLALKAIGMLRTTEVRISMKWGLEKIKEEILGGDPNRQ